MAGNMPYEYTLQLDFFSGDGMSNNLPHSYKLWWQGARKNDGTLILLTGIGN
jgi:hypothetical protein